MGPLAGITVIEIAGIGPGPFCGMLLADLGADVIRIDRAPSVRGGDPERPPADLLARGRRSVGVDLKNPDGVEVVLELVEKADALIEGFRPGRHRAARHRPRRLPRPQPAPGLRPDDRLGPGRALRLDRRPRHQLHRPRRGARADRPPGRGAGAAAEPGRRLRRRRPAPGVRPRRRPARGAAVGAGPGHRRGDGRRGGVAHDHDALVPGDGDLERRAGHQHARHRRPLLRRLRDGRRQVRVDRLDRAAVLRRAAAPHRARGRGAALAAGPRRLAGDEGAAGRPSSGRGPATSGAS